MVKDTDAIATDGIEIKGFCKRNNENTGSLFRWVKYTRTTYEVYREIDLKNSLFFSSNENLLV